jgi:hypothetical protein
MNQFTNKADVITGDGSGADPAAARGLMNSLVEILI